MKGNLKKLSILMIIFLITILGFATKSNALNTRQYGVLNYCFTNKKTFRFSPYYTTQNDAVNYMGTNAALCIQYGVKIQPDSLYNVPYYIKLDGKTASLYTNGNKTKAVQTVNNSQWAARFAYAAYYSTHVDNIKNDPDWVTSVSPSQAYVWKNFGTFRDTLFKDKLKTYIAPANFNSSYPAGYNNLTTAANNYATNFEANKKVEVKFTNTNVKASVEGKYYKFGPYKLSYTSGAKVTKTVTDLKGNAISGAYIKGDYAYVPISKNITSIKVNAKATRNYYNYTGEIWVIEHGYSQNFIAMKGERETKKAEASTSSTVTIPDGKYDLNIIKTDENGKTITSKNAKFSVNNTAKTTNKGSISISKAIKTIGTDTYTIKETEAPEGYERYTKTITVKVTKSLVNGKFVVTGMTYTPKDSKVSCTFDKNTGKITLKLKNPKITGTYGICMVKTDDGLARIKDSKATFTINGKTNITTDSEAVAWVVQNKKITSTDGVDTYTIKEKDAPDGYKKFDGTITVNVAKTLSNGKYIIDKSKTTVKVTDASGKDITSENKVEWWINASIGKIKIALKNPLTEGKYNVNLVKVDENEEEIESSEAKFSINNEEKSTTKGNLAIVSREEITKDNINKIDEYVIKELQAPEGYEKFNGKITLTVAKKIENANTDDEKYVIDIEKTKIKVEDENGKDITTTGPVKLDKTKNTITVKLKNVEQEIEGQYKVELVKEDADGENLTDPAEFEVTNKQTGKTETKTTQNSKLDITDGIVKINAENVKTQDVYVIKETKAPDEYCEFNGIITLTVTKSKEVGQYVVESYDYEVTDKDGNDIKESTKDTVNVEFKDGNLYVYVKNYQFDLALRKFIAKVNDKELKDSNGKYTRAPQVDTSKLNTVGEDGKKITTAIYNHPKTPVEVQKGDKVVYMLRVYNEGDIDGYATEIKDHLPSYLEFVEGDFNKKYEWTVSEDGRTVTSTYLDDQLIAKATKNSDGKYVLSYKEVPIMCKVKDTAKTSEVITNIADITKCKDKNKNDVTDRDSTPDNVKLPSDAELPKYKDGETGSYILGQEDDDDFEKLIIKQFDLALRKFITDINGKEVTTRIPQVKYDKEKNQITYEHSKEPLYVLSQDTVTYTIRVFNEGEIDGFAEEVTDDIPAGLEFLPDNNTNKQYRWVMKDKDGKETTDVSKAVKITTDYLSKAQGEARMNKDNLKENPALLTAFDKSKGITDTNPDYADVKVAFKVTEPNTSDKVIVNSAQISEDKDKDGNDVTDIDSVPGVWNEGEDDQDREYIKLHYFDLALRKWVTQAIVTENGKETVTNTGHDAWDDPEEVVKVELDRKKLSDVTVKFKYSIRVYNQGNIAGYAKEVTDYIPEGLKFVAEDNKGWTDKGNNIISTRLLENTLLQPGEYADVEVMLTWINGKDNVGLKVNTAEISEDYNEYGIPDIDSTPNNKVPGEDDIDDAPVILSIATGQERIYFVLGFTVLITLAGGVVLIKKYVL